jgi:peptide/nickel transport system substrate-binding protein
MVTPVGRLIARTLVGAVLLGSVTMPASLHSATASNAASSFSDSGILTLASSGSATDLDPASNEYEYADTVERNMDETLIRLAGPSLGSFEPDLATSWNSNANKSVWTFHLRHGVKFHTGRCCLTATDVKYSLGRSVAANQAGAYMLARFLTAKDPFSQIKVLDPYTVQFNLGQPAPIFPAAAAQDYNAFILDSKAVQAHATKADPFAHNWVSTHDAGTGPYMLQSWQHGQQISLVRFPDYWAGWNGKHFGKVIISTVPDAATRREVVEKGKADLTFDLLPQDVDALRANSAVKINAPYATQIYYAAMTEYGPLASPLARQALSYAFPYDALINGIYKGQAKRAYGPVPSAIMGFDQGMFHYQTNIAKARQLLQAAHVPQGTTLTCAYDSGASPPEPQICLLLQASLAPLGITVKGMGLSTDGQSNLYYGNEPPSRRPNIEVYSWWPDYNDPYNAAQTLIASSQAAPNGNNLGLYKNTQVDSLLSQMKNADTSTLVRLAKQLQDITGRQDPPAIWAAEPQQTVVMAKNLQGYVANPVELRTFYFYTMHF